MKATELKDLIVGLVAIIFFAMAIGQYDKVQSFAHREGLKALRGGSPSHPFFPAGYEVMKPSGYRAN